MAVLCELVTWRVLVGVSGCRRVFGLIWFTLWCYTWLVAPETPHQSFNWPDEAAQKAWMVQVFNWRAYTAPVQGVWQTWTPRWTWTGKLPNLWKMCKSFVNLDVFRKILINQLMFIWGLMSQHNIISIPYLIYLYPLFQVGNHTIANPVIKKNDPKKQQVALEIVTTQNVSLSTVLHSNCWMFDASMVRKSAKKHSKNKKNGANLIYVDEIMEEPNQKSPTSKFNSTTLPVCVVGFNMSPVPCVACRFRCAIALWTARRRKLFSTQCGISRG